MQFVSFDVSFEGSLRHLPLMHRRRCLVSNAAPMSEKGNGTSLCRLCQGRNVLQSGAEELDLEMRRMVLALCTFGYLGVLFAVPTITGGGFNVDEYKTIE